MSGTRNEGRGGRAAKNLMRARPDANAAALEELKRDITDLAAAIAERPDPPTLKELEDWGARLLERAGKAASGRAEPLARADLEDWGGQLLERVAAQADRQEAAAARIEAVVEAHGERLAEIGKELSREHVATRAALAGIADVADVISTDVVGLRRDLGNRTETVIGQIHELGAKAVEERPRRRVLFVLWSLLLVAASMTLEAWTHYAWQFFNWLLQ